jgi:hypothetical protein
MKRLLIVAAALAVFALAMSNRAGAQTAPAPNPPTTVGPSFVDADGDGVCDNCTGTPKGKGLKAKKGGNGPGNGTGPRGQGRGQGRGRR